MLRLILMLCLISCKDEPKFTITKVYTYPDVVTNDIPPSNKLEEFKIIIKDVPLSDVENKVEYLKYTKDFDDLVPYSAPFVHDITIKVNKNTVYFKEGCLCISLE